jgi:hypothetical protein
MYGDRLLSPVVAGFENQFGREQSSFLSKTNLLRLKLKAMRAGVWYRALQRIDRALFDLVLKVDITFRSPSLARSILSITRKLDGFLEGRVCRAIREVGFSLALKVSLFAQQWGNKAASEWAGDLSFARYLAVMSLNGQLH